MPDTKITALAALAGSSLAAADVLPIVDVSDTSMAASGTDKHVRFDGLQGALFPTGIQVPYTGKIAPTGFLMEYGQAVSRTTYSALFEIIVPLLGTCTITTASPAVVTLNAHGLVEGDAIYFTTTGTLPTGLSPNTIYYVGTVTTNTFQVYTGRSKTAVSSVVNTTAGGSGTHSCRACPYGLGDGSTTFNVPDKRGRGSVGPDAMGGSSDAGIVSALNAIGLVYGAEDHTLVIGETPSHNHPGSTAGDYGHGHGATGSLYSDVTGSGGNQLARAGNSATGGIPVAVSVSTGYGSIWVTVASQGGGGAHNNMPPVQQDNWIIKT